MPELKRIFIGVKVDLDYKKIRKIYSSLKYIILGNLTKKENLHFTLRFIGYISEEEIKIIKELLLKENLINKKIILKEEINFNGLKILEKIDYNTHKKIPKLIYISFNKTKEIEYLYSKINRIINKLILENKLNNSIKLNKNVFLPHITIIRIRKILNEKKLKEIIKKHQNDDFGVIKEIEINLFESFRDNKGELTYKKLK